MTRRGVLTLVGLTLAAAAGAQEAEVRAVRATTLDFRPAIRVLTSESVPKGEVVREGDFVVLRVEAAAPAGLALPAVDPPLESIALERDGVTTTLRVKVAPEVPFEASHEPGMLTLVFGELPAPDLRGPVTPELYARLFPAPVTETEREAPSEGVAADSEGINVGRLTLRPYVSAAWVDADVLTSDSPVPVRDQYLQVGPGVTATLPVRDGLFSAEYEARLRFLTDIPEVGETSHFAGARLELPVGSRTQLRLAHRFTRATLETNVVDPGREYFFDLQRYSYNASSALARVDLGARLWVEGEGTFAWNRFDQTGSAGGFFDYDNQTLRAGLGYDIGGDLRATVSYFYEHMPPSPDRAIVETDAHAVVGVLQGEVAPLTTASLSLGYRNQEHPLAVEDSRSWSGFTLSGGLRRELGHSTIAEIQAVRSSEPSSYDTNAFYVNNSIAASLTAPGPFQTWLRGGVGFLRNDYPNDAPGFAEPRRDDIFGWSVGIGRNLGWRAWLRADYRREVRESNVDVFDVTTDGFIVQLGLGLFGPGPGQK